MKLATIPKDSLCPCGSGSTYANCHAKTNDIWEEELGQTGYDGTKIYNNQTLFQSTAIKLSQLASKIKEVTNKTEAIKLLEEIYNTIEPGLKEMNSQASCKHGCNDCCYQAVEITPLEASLIKSYISKEYDTKWKFKMETAKANTPNLSDSEAFINHKSKNIPCVFLEENGLCGIYSVRPMNCRKYFVISNPEICKDPNGETKEWRNSAYTIGSSILVNDLSKKIYPMKNNNSLPKFF